MDRAKKASKKHRSRAKSHKRERDNRQQLREAIKWLVDKTIFDGFAFHGNTSWRPEDLVVQALLWNWSAASKLTDAFEGHACRYPHPFEATLE